MKKQKKYGWFRLKFFLLIGILFLAVFYIYVLYLYPLPNDFLLTQGKTTKIYDRNRILLYEVLIPDEGKKTLIPLEKLPKYLIYAALSSEDRNFFRHSGIDFKAIARALYLNIKEARVVSGGSTITQQLARNMLGVSNKRSWLNKIKETLLALRLEKRYSKNEILELYFNKIYYGNLAYGIESAALEYFGKHVYDLDLAEIALMAGLPQSPYNYNPFHYRERAEKRQAHILDLMQKNGYISRLDSEAAKAEPLTFRNNIHPIKAAHFVHFVLSNLEKKYGEREVHFGGLDVTTTLDYNLQRKAEEILDTQLTYLRDKNVTNGAVLTLNPVNNEILVWVGSRDYFDASISGAVDMLLALRQPGSALKPFTYLLAFLKGYTPATTVSDIHTEFLTETGPYSPKNYDLTYHGLVRLRDALGSSLNIAAVKVLDLISVPDFINFLGRLGITTLKASPEHYGLSITLGGGDVRSLDLALAYSVLANYGVKKEARSILRINESESSERNGDNQINVLGPLAAQISYQIIDILSDKHARYLGFGGDTVLELSHPAAVKTGTTRNFKDNWTIGFTRDYLTLVWVGNADASSMENISGITGAAPLWNNFMEEIHRNKEKKEFYRPEGLKEVEICKLSGKLPSKYCVETMTELFVEGTEPTEVDQMYQMLRIDTLNNRIVASDCADSAEKFEEKLFIIFPPELRRWAMEHNIPQPPEEVCSLSSKSIPYLGNIIVEIAHPKDGDSFQIDPEFPLSSQKIPFRVNARQDVKKVVFYVDGQMVGEVNEFPFTYLWQSNFANQSPSRHILSAKAVLNNGIESESRQTWFEVRE